MALLFADSTQLYPSATNSSIVFRRWTGRRGIDTVAVFDAPQKRAGATGTKALGWNGQNNTNALFVNLPNSPLELFAGVAIGSFASDGSGLPGRAANFATFVHVSTQPHLRVAITAAGQLQVTRWTGTSSTAIVYTSPAVTLLDGWNYLEIHAKLALDGTGLVELWWNNNAVGSYAGATACPAAPDATAGQFELTGSSAVKSYFTDVYVLPYDRRRVQWAPRRRAHHSGSAGFGWLV